MQRRSGRRNQKLDKRRARPWMTHSEYRTLLT